MQSPRKVLIVDDDENLCYLLCAGLRLKGWFPTAVGTMKAALEVVRSGFDVVMLDPGLPDSEPMNTISMIGRLRWDVDKVYVMTGSPVDEEFKELCKDHGAAGVMSKNAPEFLAGLTSVFGK